MKKVAIVYKFLPQYRVEFFNLLRTKLKIEGIELILIYGKLKNKDNTKGDEVDIDWALYVPNIAINIFGIELYWQPVLRYLKNVDLVIVEQANKLLINYILILRSTLFKKKFAFWGHGTNHQVSKSSWKNKFKILMITKADWWFAYTHSVKSILEHYKYPSNKITVVENAIDTKFLAEKYEKITRDEILSFRLAKGLYSNNIGIFCGGIYEQKRMDFLLRAIQIIKKNVPDFQFIIVGNGPQAYIVEEYEKKLNQKEKWVFYEGSKFGYEKVIYFAVSKVFLLPGLVGLAILDSFALQTPMITTNYLYHSPEIEYLINNQNGIITENDLNVYTKNVVKLLKDNSLIDELNQGCLKSCRYYTTERMVDNFSQGIQDALQFS